MPNTRDTVHFDRYVEALEPLFDPSQHRGVDKLFEFVCCLIRAGGMEDQGWDPILESTALIDDLSRLSTEALDAQKYPHPDKTRARLALLSYCHVIEADFFYHLLANLSRLRDGAKYDMDPFRDLKKKGKQSEIPPALSGKIQRVNELAARVDIDTASIFSEFHSRDIRNSVFHADYTLTETGFRMLHGLYRVKAGSLTRTIPFDELASIVHRSFSFYSAIMELHRRTRHRLSGLRHKILPYDVHYKALLELIFEDDLLCGFRTYWPNGSNSEFTRTHTGCTAINVIFEDDGSINFMVGVYAAKRGPFSPLVEHDAAPLYNPARGRAKVPHWPNDLKPYDAE